MAVFGGGEEPGKPSPDSDASPSLPGPVVRNCDVLFFRSKTVALNKLVGQPKLPEGRGVEPVRQAWRDSMFVAGLAPDFDNQLAKQTAALQRAN
jgi:hypothetical protein